MSWMKTFSLMIIMTVLVVVAGIPFGVTGMVTALVFAFIMNFIAFWFSDKFALMMSGAKAVSEQEEPQLHALVADVARLAKLPKPKVYIIDNDTPNAFATGRDPEHAVVAVTTGIRRILSEQELRGVLAHEMGHVRNRDMLTMTIVAVMAGVISFLGTMAMWGMLLGGGMRGRDRDSGASGYIGLIFLLVLIIVMPLAAAIVRFAISRTREYAADETGARIIRNPLALADALQKLDAAVRRKPLPATATAQAMAHMYIVNPFSDQPAMAAHENGGSQFVTLFSTHPPISDRVRRLKEMALEVR